MPLPNYSTGTLAIGAGATAVVGTGTNWLSPNAKAGDTLLVPGFAGVLIEDVTDALHLVIDAWPFAAVAAGAAYKIIQNSPFRFVGAQAAADVQKLIGVLDATGFYVFVSSIATVPDPSLGDDQQYAFQATTGKLWQKQSGVWNFVGTFKGWNSPVAWNGATAYLPFDTVTLNGSSYLCLLANTNQSPPNATYWQLIAAKGDQGNTGATGAVPWSVPVAWVTATNYVVGPPASNVVQGGETYICLVPHTSGVFATDLAAGKWIKVTQKGTGDVLASNNGSEFPNDLTFANNTETISYAGAQALTAAQRLQARSNIGSVLRGHIAGLILSTAGSSATFSIAAGEAADSTAADLMVLASAFTKTTGAWAVGSGNGSLDIGAIAVSTWYYPYLIKRPDTGVVDVLTSLSPGQVSGAPASGCTLTIASPGNVNSPVHGLQANAPVVFQTSGALPTGLVAGTTYFVKTVVDQNNFTVSATQGGTVINFTGSQSGSANVSSSPALPANYTLSRRIGAMKTNGSSQWTKFIQIGDRFIWDVPVNDVNAYALTSVSVLFPLSVPLGISVDACFVSVMTSAGAGAQTIFQSPLIATQTANVPVGNFMLSNQVISQFGAGQIRIQTDTSQNIRAVGAVSTNSLYIVTTDWLDTRGRLA